MVTRQSLLSSRFRRVAALLGFVVTPGFTQPLVPTTLCSVPREAGLIVAILLHGKSHCTRMEY